MLGISGTGRLSRGTAATMVEHAGQGGMVRRNGQLVRVPMAFRTRDIDFGNGPQPAMTIPWGDVATAWYSTKIPNIEVYAAVPARIIRLARAANYLGWLLRMRWFKRLQLARIRGSAPGPAERELSEGHSYFWGRVENDRQDWAEARMQGPNGYQLTRHTALLILQRVLAGAVRPGFQTPSLAYGPDLISGVPGVLIVD